MFCNKCGNQIAEGSRFCSACGAPVAEETVAVEPVQEISDEQDIVVESVEPNTSRSMFDDIQWNVTEYPGGTPSEKTEDIDFDWNADPKDIRDRYTRGLSTLEKAEINAKADLGIENITPSPEPEIVLEPAAPVFEELSASDKIDKFYTFSSQNEEFQKLLNKEYGKIQSGNLIGQEQGEADKVAAKKFEEREMDPSMDAFLQREGIVKPYEPKPFESDVLRKIEAQERAKEEAVLEEEARQKALEEARLKAEAEMRAAEEKARLEAEEEARIKALEEAKLRAVEEARQKAAEEAKKAAEEARKAEEAARIAAEREAAIRAEEEARLREEQKNAMLRAQAELKAQQEAAKIREQQEARRLRVEEEQHMAEVERRRREEARIKDRLAREQETLAEQADSAATAEEVRRVLAQTARMREEEAAKIRAAVAGLKGEETKPAEPTPQPVPAVPVMPVEIREEVPAAPAADEANLKAHRETQNDLNGMAKARQAFLEEFGIKEDMTAPAVNEPAELKPEPIPVPEKKHTPVTMEELLGERPVTGRNTMHSEGTDMTATRVVDKAAVLAGMESTMRISKEEIKASVNEEKTDADETPAAVNEPPATVEDLLQQFDDKNGSDDNKPLDLNELVSEGFAPKEEPAVQPVPAAAEGSKPGLDNTMVLTDSLADNVPGEFDSFGEQEAEEFRRRQEDEELNRRREAESAMDSFYADTEAEETMPEEDISEENTEKKGGAGRVILKVLLVILIVIFAVELAGIAIKFLAPDSGAAKFIDNQLNKVIHLITGCEPDYTVEGIDYEA